MTHDNEVKTPVANDAGKIRFEPHERVMRAVSLHFRWMSALLSKDGECGSCLNEVTDSFSSLLESFLHAIWPLQPLGLA